MERINDLQDQVSLLNCHEFNSAIELRLIILHLINHVMRMNKFKCGQVFQQIRALQVTYKSLPAFQKGAGDNPFQFNAAKQTVMSVIDEIKEKYTTPVYTEMVA